MGTNYVPLICYCDGELQDSAGGPNYIGGFIRADRVSKDINFMDFVNKMRDLCKVPSKETTITIKCRYLLDQHTSIAMQVEDDTSLSIIMDLHPNQCNAIAVYVEIRPAQKSSSTSQRHENGSSSVGDANWICTSNPPAQVNVNCLASHDLVIDMHSSASMLSNPLPRYETPKLENKLKLSSGSKSRVTPEEYTTTSTFAVEHLKYSVGNSIEEFADGYLFDPNIQGLNPDSVSSIVWLQDSSPMGNLNSRTSELSQEIHSRVSNSLFGTTILDPKDPYCQKWTKAFLLACMIGLVLDALFFYSPITDDKKNCLDWDKRLGITVCLLRSISDVFYVLRIILQFRTGFIDRSIEDNMGGSWEIARIRREIAKKYLSSYFLVDILAVLPLPQVCTWLIFSRVRGSLDVRETNSLHYVVLVQYLPRCLRIYALYKQLREGNAMIGTAWAGTIFNFSLYMLASHMFGSFWYFLSVERKTICWWDACSKATTCNHDSLYCGDESSGHNEFVYASCPIVEPNTTVFAFGIYLDALQSGILESSFMPKLVYCFWWGLQNLGSLGQNLKTSSYVWEVCFVVSTSLFGLFLLMLVISNMQTYLQSDSIKKEVENRKQLRYTEKWMSQYSLPESLKQRLRQNELWMLQRSKGFDDENMIHHIPRDLRRDIKRHLCVNMLKRIILLEQLDENIMHALCDHLLSAVYTEGCYIMREGEPAEEMFFILRGKVACVSSRDGFSQWHLQAGDYCGMELITGAFSANSKRPMCRETLRALTEVECFVLKRSDWKYFIAEYDLFSDKKIQHTVRHISADWRIWAAYYVQAAWLKFCKRKVRRRGYASIDPLDLREVRRFLRRIVVVPPKPI